MAWERYGNCNKCGICCLIDRRIFIRNPATVGFKGDDDYFKLLREGWRPIKITEKKVYLARWDPCPYLKFNLECSIHNNPERPGACKAWPHSPTDEYYKAIRKICSYRFRRVKKTKK